MSSTLTREALRRLAASDAAVMSWME
jgi:hypothetical protein